MKREILSALKMTVVLTIVTGIVYPLLTFLLAQTLFRETSNGSLAWDNGVLVGSTLIGQPFTAPGYFHPRPSAAGSGYDATASGGTNLGPTSDKLINGDEASRFDGVKQLAAAVRQENGLASDANVPVDAVTRSGSGLDPDISAAYAELQVHRVARQRGLSDGQVRDVVAQATSPRQLGILGEPRVNVLTANRLLEAAAAGRSGAPISPFR